MYILSYLHIFTHFVMYMYVNDMTNTFNIFYSSGSLFIVYEVGNVFSILNIVLYCAQSRPF